MDTKFKIKYRQTRIGWCSLLTIANALDEEKFLDYVLDERYKGCSNEDIDFILNEQKTELKINDLAYINYEMGKLRVEDIFPIFFRDHFKMTEPIDRKKWNKGVFLLAVRLTEKTTLFHHVAVINIDDKLYYLDPYNEYYKSIETWEDLAKQFHSVYQVSTFERKDIGYYAVFTNHLIEDGFH